MRARGRRKNNRRTWEDSGEKKNKGNKEEQE